MMELLSAAIIAFFCIFSGAFICVEYSDGVIKNKIAAGHSRAEIYFSHLITQLIAEAVMMVVWIIAGDAAGAAVNATFIEFVLRTFFYIAGIIALLTFIGMCVSKKYISSFAGIGILYLTFNFMLIANYLCCMVFYETPLEFAAKIVYNLTAVGQWFAASYIGASEDALHLPFAGSIVISILKGAVFTYLGISVLNKKEIQ
jgi:ABC-type transport system involved in multi-copper enzyme maturation permease subunit